MRASELIRRLTVVVADVGDQEVYLTTDRDCEPVVSVGGSLSIYIRTFPGPDWEVDQ